MAWINSLKNNLKLIYDKLPLINFRYILLPLTQLLSWLLCGRLEISLFYSKDRSIFFYDISHYSSKTINNILVTFKYFIKPIIFKITHFITISENDDINLVLTAIFLLIMNILSIRWYRKIKNNKTTSSLTK